VSENGVRMWGWVGMRDLPAASGKWSDLASCEIDPVATPCMISVNVSPRLVVKLRKIAR